MSIAHVEQFIKKAMGDSALLQRLSPAAGSVDTYVAACIIEAKKMGYDFTAGEATGYIKQFVEQANKGELSDLQLEAVSGGKGIPGFPGVPGGLPGIPGIPKPPVTGMPILPNFGLNPGVFGGKKHP